MVFLHPAFSALFIFLMITSYAEMYVIKKKTSFFMIVTAIVLIILSGFRYFVGADYPVYKNLFTGFSMFTTYGDVLDKAFFKSNSEQIEWIYVLLNKIIFDLGLPFYIVTFVMALVSISLKFTTIYENVALPTLGAFMYFMPLFFFEDSGQIRQGMGVAICVFSFRFIKSRNLPLFLLTMYIALGFHKTSIVFLPAYWIVKIPMNSKRIFAVLLLAILMSPFEVYRVFGSMLDSLSPQDVSDGFSGYVDDSRYGAAVDFGLADIIKVIFVVILILYNEDAERKIPYYEYMRNLAVFGLFLYYIMRGNRIFAIRLPGAYMFFVSVFVMPNIVYATKNYVKKMLHTGFLVYLFLMYFNFSRGNGVGGNFIIGKYNNYLWK